MKRIQVSHPTRIIRLISLSLCAVLLLSPLAVVKSDSTSHREGAPRLKSPARGKNIKTSRPASQTATAQKARARDNELLVRFRQNIPPAEIDALLQANTAQHGTQLRGQSGMERLHLAAGSDPEAVAANFRASQKVDLAEPNYLITADQTTTQMPTQSASQTPPNDPHFAEQWALQNTGTNGGQLNSDINATQAWGVTTGSPQTVIAILDSGIDFTHPDLKNNEWTNTFEQANNHDDDQNGFIDDLHGWDFVTNTAAIKDEAGHGTAIAGIIAAEGNNATGMTGVMWKASLMSLRVLDNTGTGDVAAAIEAIDYAVQNGAQVINCSWGTDGTSTALQQAINWAARRGVVVVTSAGNSSLDVETTPHYPASYTLNNLISVAATDNTDALTSFSNWGTHHVSIAAPGTDILTTKMGGDYQTISGTSAAVAFVTGVVGLVKTMRPWLSAARTRQMILQGVRPVSALSDKVAAKGVVSASGALNAMSTLRSTDGLDSNNGNNGGEHTDSNGNGRGNNRNGGGNGNGNNGNSHDGREFSVTPPARTTGAPGLGLPNLDDLRRKPAVTPQNAPAIPSTRCSHHKPDCDQEKKKQKAESNAPSTLSTPAPVEMLASALSIPSETWSMAALLKSAGMDAARMNATGGAISDSPFSLFAPPFSFFAPLSPPSAPANLVASATPTATINLTWTAASGSVNHYQIERSQSINGPFVIINTSQTPSYSDTTVTSINAYLYRVRAVNNIGEPSQPSNMVLATSITYTDDPLVAGTTLIRAQHLTELRQAVNAVRQVAGLSPATWTDSTITSGVTLIRAAHVQELRDRLGEALTVLNVPNPSYTDPTLSAGQNGTLIRQVHFAELRARVLRGTSSSSGPLDSSSNFSVQRLDPNNRTGAGGVDLLSGNVNWSLPIVGLKGRAGLDLGLSLTYNSLVWTADTVSNTIKFDADEGYPGPGFRLGFPVIQPRYYNSQVGVYAYLLISPSGSHTELRQVGSSNVYQAADSSYLQLTDYGGSLTLQPTDGSQLTYTFYNDQYQCTQIEDRNGNLITASYDPNDGRLLSVTDTLGRQLTFNYDIYLNLTSITQTWTVNGQATTHQWATFGWGTVTISTSFTNQVVGPQNGAVIPVLNQVSFADGTRFNFDYNSYAQVTTVHHYAADNHQLSYTSYTLPANGNDCPRVTDSHEYAENWNNNQEAITNYSAVSDHSSCQMTMPDGTIYKELYATTSWQRGLSTGTEFWSGGVKKKWTTTAYTQDDTNLSYQKNPRVTETNIYDLEGNRKRTTIDYSNATYAQYGLPYYVDEYQADGTTLLRRTYTDYNLSQAYLDRRIIGLVSAVHVSDGTAWQSKTGYEYDSGGDQLQATVVNATQHDASYSASLTTGRGNLTAVSRYDVTDINNEAKKLTTRLGYDTDGSVLLTRDALWQSGQAGHQVSVSYTDSFSESGQPSNTFAYPTTMTDADGFSSIIQYNYDFGAVTRTQGPPPANQTQGAIQTFVYDSAGRTSQINNVNNGAYKRWVYDPFGYVSQFDTIQNGAPEAYSTVVYDGAGRVRATGGDLPNSSGGYRGQFTLYDILGRDSQVSNMEEINGSWAPSGDDAAGWFWTQQAYDWNGRPTTTINPDGTTKLITYGGCGCAGGEVTTVRDEVGRQQRVTADVLGRAYKTEVLNWDGSVYSTVINTYNALDQLTDVKHYQGTPSSGVYLEGIKTYDGYGRLQTSKAPEQTSPTNYTYNLDDTTNVITDARGATTGFSYNNRHQVTGITYTVPSLSNITNTVPVSFQYDAAGNRTLMTDGTGSTSYSYDQLSRLTSETRTFTNVGSLTLSYGYNLAGEVTSITDPWGAQIGYTFDKTGRVTDVTGAGYANVTSYASNLQYRAWGGMKGMTYGNGYTLSVGYNSRLQLTGFVIAGRPAQYGSSTVMQKQYSYWADGSLKSAHDVLDERMDRVYDYDHTGRLQAAYSGSEARDFLNNTSGSTPTGPYRQTYSFDVWGEMTATTNRFWSEENDTTASYQNGRNQNPQWQYDADGRILQDDSVQYQFDAAGHTRQLYNAASVLTITQEFDGDGQIVRNVQAYQGAQQPFKDSRYLRSSVFGGRVIAEVATNGTKITGYVYSGNEVLATQANNTVTWEHTDPLVGSQGESQSNGSYTQTVEADPTGVNMGEADPWIDPDPVGFTPDTAQPMIGGIGGLGGSGCSNADPNCVHYYLDGMEVSPEFAHEALANGSAVYAPPTTVWANGQWNFVPFNPDTGQYGYWDTKISQGQGAPVYDPETGEYIDVYTSTIGNHFVPYRTDDFSGLDFFSYGWNQQTNEKPNPNCLRYAVKGSPGLANPFRRSSANPNMLAHIGAHTLSPQGVAADAVTLPPLAGKIIKVGDQDNTATTLHYVDVRLANGNVAVYFDLQTVSKTSGYLRKWDVIGTVRPGGDPQDPLNSIGLHTTIVRGQYYNDFNLHRSQYTVSGPLDHFIDPLGPDSPVRCPGETVRP